MGWWRWPMADVFALCTIVCWICPMRAPQSQPEVPLKIISYSCTYTNGLKLISTLNITFKGNDLLCSSSLPTPDLGFNGFVWFNGRETISLSRRQSSVNRPHTCTLTNVIHSLTSRCPEPYCLSYLRHGAAGRLCIDRRFQKLR